MKAKYMSLTTHSERTNWYTRTLSSGLGDLLRAASPQIVFLICYALNTTTHVLPLFTDLGCIRLNNITDVELSAIGFSTNRWLSSTPDPALDVLAAIPYLLHYTIPVLGPLYIYLTRGRDEVARFFWLLGWASWVLYVIWFIYPTGPPWLMDSPYGDLLAAANGTRIAAPTPEMMKHIHKQGCAFARLDERSGVPFFYHMFAGNPVPFASFPSGHVVWPTCLLVTGTPGGRLFSAYVLWVAWATLYSCHHYLLDAVSAVAVVMALRRLFAMVWPVGSASSSSMASSSCRSNCAVACPLSMV